MRIREHRGVNLSVVGLGCYGLSGAYGPPRPRRFTRVLDRAIELGVNYIDTAPTYGDAERLVGRAIAGRRDAVFLATKIAVASDGKADLSRKAIRASCEESLARLGTDRVDLLQIHYDDPRVAIEDAIDSVETLLREGKIRFYGLAHIPAERAAAYARIGRCFSIQMELSALARQSETTLLPLCRRHRLLGVAFSATARGLLTGRVPGRRGFATGDIRRIDPLFQRERMVSGRRIAEEMARIGRAHGRSPAQLAIAWALSRPGIGVVLTGASRIEHLEENVAAADWAPPQATMRALEEFLDRELEWVLGEQRSAIRSILTRPLPSDPEAAFADLIYAMETSVDGGLAREEDLLPVFRDLYALRGLRDPSLFPRFERLRARLSELAGFSVSS